MLLTVALALLLAQGASAVLIYRAEAQMREIGLVHSAAFRLLRALRSDVAVQGLSRSGDSHGPRIELSDRSPQRSGEGRDQRAEMRLREILADQDVIVGEIAIVRRSISDDPISRDRITRRGQIFGRRHGPTPDRVLVAAVQLPNRTWLAARVVVPPGERIIVASLLAQTVFIYIILVGAIALILRRITRPLATLTGQIERFTETRDAGSQIAPEGPDDIRRLIVAHNAMEARISALLDEKDVMLGAIGHDLKTPLAALRVRIESVEDDRERGRMAATIEDIANSLDDILSLARAGRARDPSEITELSALLASVVE